MTTLRQKLEQWAKDAAKDYSKINYDEEWHREITYEAFRDAASQIIPMVERLEMAVRFAASDNYQGLDGNIRATVSARTAQQVLAELEKFLEASDGK